MNKWSKRDSGLSRNSSVTGSGMSNSTVVAAVDDCADASADTSANAAAGTDAAATTTASLDSASARMSVRRRQFLGRVGLLASGVAGSALFSTPALADCDSSEDQLRRCSDNDTGDGADPRGCGQCGRANNAPARRRMRTPLTESSAAVEASAESSSYTPPRVRRISWTSEKE